MKKKAISMDGTSIAWDSVGNGFPLILVDGALCSRSFGPMRKLALHLAADFTVITYDRRGRGESGDTAPYSVAREVEDIQALIQGLGGSAFAFGISSGAVLALLAAASGIGIKRLAMYEPPFINEADIGHHAPTDSERQLSRLVAAGRRNQAVRYFMVDMVGMPAFFAYIMRLLPVWPKLKSVAHTLPYDAAVMGNFKVPIARVAAISVPTLVLGGKKSRANMQSAVDAASKAIPGAEKVMLKNQAHNVSTEVLAPVLSEFFARSCKEDQRK